MNAEDDFQYTEEYFETKVCTADWLNGLSIDVLEYSGIGNLTTQQKEKLWEVHTDLSLIRLCEECFMVKTGEIDEVPGQATEFFSVMTDNEDRLKAELREQILAIVK